MEMTKYSRAEIMRRAWEIKSQDKTYIFGECLKMAWAEAKAPKIEKTAKELFVEKLLAAGANRWQKYGHDRIYVSGCESVFGIELRRFNTGNISYCELNGEEISNNRARKYVSVIENGYIDLKDMKLYARNCDYYIVEYFNDVIAEKIA